MEEKKFDERKIFEYSLFKYLQSQGYPSDKTVFNFKASDEKYFDVAIFDEDSATPIAIIEIMHANSLISKCVFAINEFKKLSKQTDINTFFYAATISDKNWDIYDLTYFVYNDIPITADEIKKTKCELPPYKFLAAGGNVKKKIKQRAYKKKYVDMLKIFSWGIIPLLSILLLVLDAKAIYTFNSYRLLVIGATVLIALLPFFSQISFKDVSFVREKRKQKEENQEK